MIFEAKETEEPEIMEQRSKVIKQYISAVLMVATLMAAAFVSVRYLEYIRKNRDMEVASQLEEVYGQVSRQFNELAERNWNLLSDGAMTFGLSNSESVIDAYIVHLKNQWGFHKWLFIDENGRYIDTEGHTGYLNMGRDFSLLAQKKQRIVIDGTLAGSEPVMLFAIPVGGNTYKGFEFVSVALAYKKEELKEVLDNKAYKGTAECYLIYPDGRIFLSREDHLGGRKNIFTYLKETDFREEELKKILSDIRQGEAGASRYSVDGKSYYLHYLPVGFQNWMMVGIVPQASIGIYVDRVLRQAVGMSAVSVMLVMLCLVGIVYYKHRRMLRQKEMELSYRERMFELLSGNTTMMFLVVVPDTYQVEYISPNSEQLIGVPSEAIMKDISLLEDADHISQPGLKWEKLKEIPLGGTAKLESVRQHAKTGEHLWFEEIIHHVEIEGIERYIFMFQDRTKEKENQRNMKMALDIARAANASKSEFLNNMSHDIRTPMNVIIGFLPLLQRDADNVEKVREYARKISASSRHLLGLISDILDMSKIESGKTSMNISEFNLAELVDGLALIVRPQASAKHQDFDIFVQDIRYERLIGDSMKINQILINILSNAVKYTPVGGNIKLTVKQLPQTTKHIIKVRFTVSDNGIGMSQEYQKVIFEPFSREQNSKAEKEHGTGLGMSIVKNLVDLMGGSISIQSKPGEGSTFVVDLGMRIREDEADKDFWKNHSLFRTLVVDDDKEICDNVVQTVSHSGLNMEYALSGEEALEKVQRACMEEKTFDLLLLDWKMPGMSGLETASRIRKIVPENVPILILTAYDWSEIEAEAKQVGIDGFLAKPFFLTNFKETVEQVCSPKQEKEKRTSNLRGLHVLVAEDFALNAEILVETLSMYGISCDVCENGKETVERFLQSKEQEYDMILMDIRMPVMNGCEATREIRASAHARAASIPIIAMSANAFSEDIQKAMEAGMDAYLTKPIDADLLEKTLIDMSKEERHE